MLIIMNTDPSTLNRQKSAKIKTFSKESTCLCFNLRKAARAITQVYDELLRPINLTATQVHILGALEEFEMLTILQLADVMATDRTTITRNLKPLVRDGFIIIKEGSDRRKRTVISSDKGKQYFQKALERFKSFQHFLNDSVGVERLGRLCQDLNQVVDKVQSR